MSYTRSFSRTIAVHYSGTVSYPASETGGFKSYSGTEYETVVVDVTVDTDPFDDSIDSCNDSVNVLTGSVVATEGAQVESIRHNSRRIGQTIVKGFFKTVQSELTQQIAELQAKLDATLIHLKKMAERCTAKQQQMANDYGRLKQRYTKLFDDLDRELENRIHALDEPTFKFRRQADALQEATTGNHSASTVAVAGSENGALHSRIAASIAKRQAHHAINQANSYIARQQRVDRLVSKALLDSNTEGTHYAPVVYVETVQNPGVSDRDVYTSPLLANVNKARMANDLQSQHWAAGRGTDEVEKIRRYYNTAVSENIQSSRVAQYMVGLFDLSNAKKL